VVPPLIVLIGSLIGDIRPGVSIAPKEELSQVGFRIDIDERPATAGPAGPSRERLIASLATATLANGLD
jgi:hypothetical protein